MERAVKISRLLAVALCVGIILMPAAPLQAGDDGALEDALLALWPLEARTTSGPVPPKGLFRGVSAEALDYEVTIPGVPAYLWLNGCGPTAAGMIFGYWDARGFNNLVPGDASTQTAAVDDMISTSGNYNDYCLPMDSPGAILPDLSEPPFGDEHPDDCIADFMKTSQSYHGWAYGWSNPLYIDDAFMNYAQFADPNYVVSSQILIWTAFTWDRFRAEIDAGRPVILLVDLDGQFYPDHFVTAIGYGEEGGVPMYGCLDTWDHNIHWFEFKRFTPGVPWGFYGASTCSIRYVGPIQINLQTPADLSRLSAAPTLTWATDAGTNNVFAMDLSLSPGFGVYWSTLENAGQIIGEESWAMPPALWSVLPAGTPIYWRVRGANLDQQPLAIATSDEVWSFTKQ